MNLIIVAIALVQLTGPDGRQRIDMNPNEITSIREPRKTIGEHFAKGTHCVIATTSGKLTAVHENCETVRKEIMGPPQGHGPCTLVCGGSRS
jgi:hypothetical protein